jgi:hypothetical protein
MKVAVALWFGVLAYLFAWQLTGCSSSNLPWPEDDAGVPQTEAAPPCYESGAAMGLDAGFDATLPWFGYPDPDHTYVPHRMR